MFSVGNLVVFSVVLIIVFIFRRLDNAKTNPEVVKKRFNELVGQLDEIAAQQREKLRNLKLEISSEQKTTVSLLERSKKLSQTVLDQEPKIVSLQERLNEFDSLLPQLMSMTEIAQKNIVNIQKESEYIDSVGKRIKMAQTSLGAVETELEQIHTHFDQKNQKHLQETENRVLAASEARGSTLLSSIQDSTDQASTILDDVEMTMQSIEEKEGALREYIDDILEKTAEKIREEATKSFDESSKRMDEYGQTIVEKHKDTLEDVEKNVAVNVGIIENLSTVCENKLVESEERFQTLKEALSEQSENLGKIYEKQAMDLSDMAADKERAFIQSMKTVQAEYEELVSNTKASLYNEEREAQLGLQGVAKEMEENLVGLLGSMRDTSDDIEEKFTGLVQGAEQDLSDLHEKVKTIEHDALQELEHEFQEKLNVVQKDRNKVMADFQAILDNLHIEKSTISDTVVTEMEELRKVLYDRQSLIQRQLLEDFENSKRKAVQEVRDKSLEVSEALHNVISEQQSEIDKQNREIRKGLEQSQERLQGWREEVSTEIGKQRIEIVKEMEQSHERLQDWHKQVNSEIDKRNVDIKKEIEESQEQLQNWREQVNAEMGKQKAEIWKEMEQSQEKLHQWQEEFTSNITMMDQVISEAKQNSHLQEEAMKKNIATFDEKMDAMQKDLEKAGSDLSESQKTLLMFSKRTIDEHILSLSEEVQGRILSSEQVLSDQLKTNMASLEETLSYRVKRLEAIPDQLNEFEGSLKEAVKRTHDEVSERLVETRSSIEEKQAQVLGELDRVKEAMSNAVEAQRLAIRTKEEDLAGELSQINANIHANITTLDTRCEDALKERESVLKDFVTDLATQLQKSLEGQIEELDKTLKNNTQERYQSTKAEVFDTLTDLRNEVMELRRRNDHLISESNDQIQQYKEQFHELMSKTTIDFQNFLNEGFTHKETEWKKKFAERFQSITDTFTGQEEQFLERITKLQNELITIEHHVESQLNESSRKQTEFFGEMETKKSAYSEELLTIMQGMRDQFVDIRTRFIEQFTAESQMLERQIEKLEKKHDGFVEQTKIFDRVEQRTNELKRLVVDIQSEIENLKQERKWLLDLENRLQKTKKSVRDTEQQIGKFLNEKRRVEHLEKSFAALMQQSQNIDIRTREVVAKSDDIDRIQLLLRDLKSIETEVDERSTRLLEKKELIDTTIESAQVGFSNLQKLEKDLEAYGEKLIAVPMQIDDMQRVLDRVEDRQTTLEELAKRTDKMNEVLQDSEDRIKKLETAREWLAQEETRYSNMKRQIQDQLQSLNHLIQTELTEVHKEAGAPNNSSRKTVMQLSKQGWNSDEISRVTKLSKGEVELILEMTTESIG